MDSYDAMMLFGIYWMETYRDMMNSDFFLSFSAA